MELFKLKKKYKIVIQIGREISYYTAEILEENDTHFRFKDKLGKEYTFSKDSIKKIREIE